jgi:hypothetical protein
VIGQPWHVMKRKVTLGTCLNGKSSALGMSEVVRHGVREARRARRVDGRLERQAGQAAVPVAIAVGDGWEEEVDMRVVVVVCDAAIDTKAQDQASHEDEHGGDEAEQAGGLPALREE